MEVYLAVYEVQWVFHRGLCLTHFYFLCMLLICQALLTATLIYLQTMASFGPKFIHQILCLRDYTYLVKKIQGWSTNWHMTLNTEMSEVMAISTKRNKSVYPGLLIDDKRLKEISSHKHLGPTLSSDMSWTAHANILHACLQKCGSKTKLMEKACI